MNWDAIGAVGEVIGGVLVLATLFYLARQIKQNTRETRSSSYHQVTDSFNAINLSIAQSPELGDLYVKGNAYFESLTEAEQARYAFLILSPLRVMDVIYHHSRTGTADSSLWESEIPTLMGIFSAPGTRDWWKRRQFHLSPEFVEFVDRQMIRMIENDA
jgi:hypothetical protein